MKIISNLNSFALKCKRVWLVLKKPSRKEFEQTSKVAAIGIAIIGIIGFLFNFNYRHNFINSHFSIFILLL
jgi:protein transport protein SEC61 subunit gamma-like protein